MSRKRYRHENKFVWENTEMASLRHGLAFIVNQKF